MRSYLIAFSDLLNAALSCGQASVRPHSTKTTAKTITKTV